MENKHLPTPAPSRLHGQWHNAGFVAHHSCGTVAASHRLPRTAIQIGKQQTCSSNHIAVKSICDFTFSNQRSRISFE